VTGPLRAEAVRIVAFRARGCCKLRQFGKARDTAMLRHAWPWCCDLSPWSCATNARVRGLRWTTTLS